MYVSGAQPGRGTSPPLLNDLSRGGSMGLVPVVLS